MPELKVLEKSKLKEPKMFKVILLNDDIITADFVIEVLINIFYRDFETASKIMLGVHLSDSGICGVYTQEIALSEQKKVPDAAKLANFPLQTRVEEE